jgi:hypothetical protein
MDSSMSELADRVEALESQLKELQVLINKMILMMNLAETDLKEHLYLLDS